MKGKVLDAVLVVGFAIAFFTVAIVHPGLGNALIAWGGLVVLGYYNSFVRHDRGLERAQLSVPGRPIDVRDTLRGAWR
ncbi:hypothetical protein DFR76_115136 [Nocardia pseudobrasiliensis]|uniref:Uncharacterized protein n=2 Tax=Nocardia pseudobrasiliensis TaxID=45979 RepID=A0A370HPJ8_9NOCA|nr:hypothetical protein DFR76_115136 [Nocardia pseudobrasiliensis]